MSEELIGRTVVDIRQMTADEAEAEWWACVPDRERPTVVVLDDGKLLYPAKDPEGNGPGALFGWDPDAKRAFEFGTDD